MSERKNMGNRGFTLVEIILSIAILALISVPLLKYFSDSLKYAAQTAEKQKATLIAQETVESIKAQKKIVVPVSDPSPSPGATAAPTTYNLTSELLNMFGGYSGAVDTEAYIPTQFYNTGATLDATGAAEQLVYRYVDQKSGKYYMEVGLTCTTEAASVSSPAILGIDDTRNVVIAERTEEQEALAYFKTLNVNQFLAEEGDIVFDPDQSPSPTPDDDFEYVTIAPGPTSTPASAEYKLLSESELRENMDRIIYIKISKGLMDSYYTVTAYYVYFCKDVYGPGTNSNKSISSADLCVANVEYLEGIYLMFNRLSPTCDNIQIEWDVADPYAAYPDFRFVVQDSEPLAPADPSATSDPFATPTPTPAPTADPGAIPYTLKVNFLNFTEPTNPTIHANLEGDSFQFMNILSSLKEPDDVDAGESVRSAMTVLPLTGDGVPVRIFDVEVKVYADKAAFMAGKDPLVSLKTAKVE